MTKQKYRLHPNIAIRKNTSENYCSLGKEYGCPDLADCPTRGIISIEVLQIDKNSDTYRNPEHSRQSPQDITEEIREKLRGAMKWNRKEVGRIIEYACTERREERGDLISKSLDGGLL
jgi:hypothetical protein